MKDKENEFDVIVVGGGPGGIASAIRVAQLGGSVCLIEKAEPGGVCMNRGCIPYSHMMMAIYLMKKVSTLGKEMGIETKGAKINLSAMFKRQSEIINALRGSIERLLSSKGIKVIKGIAKIVSPGKIRVNDKIFIGKRLIIATGGRWEVPDFLKRKSIQLITSDHILNMTNIKGSFLVTGNSLFSIQIAQYLNAIGGKVHLHTEDKRLFDRETKSISTRISKLLKEEEVNIIAGKKVSSIKKDRGKYSISFDDGEDIVVVNHIVCMNRSSNLDGVMIDGLTLNETGGHIKVNDRMETSVDGVYAVGDVCSPYYLHFSHLASLGGIIAGENAMGLNSSLNKKVVPRVIYTNPQIAFVGISKKEAKEKGYETATGSAPLV